MGKKYNDEDLLVSREAARVLGISDSTLAEYRELGRISFFRYSTRKILYSYSDLIAFMDTHKHLADWE